MSNDNMTPDEAAAILARLPEMEAIASYAHSDLPDLIRLARHLEGENRRLKETIVGYLAMASNDLSLTCDNVDWSDDLDLMALMFSYVSGHEKRAETALEENQHLRDIIETMRVALSLASAALGDNAMSKLHGGKGIVDAYYRAAEQSIRNAIAAADAVLGKGGKT